MAELLGVQEVSCSTSVGEGEDQRKVSASFEYNFPQSVDEAVERYGEETTLHAINQWTNSKGQNDARRLLQNGVAPESIPEEMADWDPTKTVSTGGDPFEKALSEFGNKSDEEKEAFLRRLQEIAG